MPTVSTKLCVLVSCYEIHNVASLMTLSVSGGDDYDYLCRLSKPFNSNKPHTG